MLSKPAKQGTHSERGFPTSEIKGKIALADALSPRDEGTCALVGKLI
jgi:hypothetical protein